MGKNTPIQSVARPANSLILIHKEKSLDDTVMVISKEVFRLVYQRNTSLPLHKIRITSAYGYRSHPILGSHGFHSGIDLAASRDTVFAIFDGTVVQASYDNNLGLNVQLHHTREISSIYGHMSRLLTVSGQAVSSGQAIGISGSTGRSTGEHLHFTVKMNNRTVDPVLVLQYLIDSELNYDAMDVINSMGKSK